MEICISFKLTDNLYSKVASFKAYKGYSPFQSVWATQNAIVFGKYYFLTFVNDFSSFITYVHIENQTGNFSKFKDDVK